tara:strand:+ start:735 stop:998 length:264 start_codon:yes stop_codon:yes gene_type:complete
MNRRSTSITVAHSRAFNHYILLKEGCDLGRWSEWLKTEFGQNKPFSETMREQRWAVIGGNVGFRDPDDAKVFMKAANDDLARDKRQW